MNEIWKDVKDYEGLYQVSNLGKIRKLRFINNKVNKEKIFNITPQIMNTGYKKVVLYKNGCYKNMLLHRLIAEVFIPNKENKLYVNHKNGIKTDNRVENLEWCTSSENNLHAYKNNLKKAQATGKFGSKNPKAKRVNMIDINTNKVIAQFDSLVDAAKFIGVNNCGCISRCCKGLLKTTHGYMWEYSNSTN